MDGWTHIVIIVQTQGVCISRVVQELLTASLTGNGGTDRQTHIVIIVQIQGRCNFSSVLAE